MDEEPTVGQFFEVGFDEFIATLARIFAHRGNAAGVAVLSEGNATPRHKWTDPDIGGIAHYEAWLNVPQAVFNSVVDRIYDLEKELLAQAKVRMRSDPGVVLENFIIYPQLVGDPDWRAKAKAWLKGENVNNQGRVRSDNVAPFTQDGLLFRSKAEINLYEALKSRGVTFAPLPVFVRGGDNYRRIGPDFIIFQSGKVIVIELDGPPFHVESPSEAHERTTMLYWEGAHIERVSASECDTPEEAQRVANQIQALIRKLVANK
jgi:hypothetical protein